MLIQWEPPQKSNGELTSYIVYYTHDASQPFSAWSREETASGRATSTTVKSLKPDSIYSIRVQAQNAKGAGPLSQPISVVTTHGSECN